MIAQDVAVTVWPVRTAAELNAWIRLPRRLVYPATSPWVAPLDGDLRRMLDRHANPFFERGGDALPLLAFRGRRPIGRILALIHEPYRQRHDSAAHFGFFECADDTDAARGLVEAAATYAIQHGCDRLRGPFNMTAMQEMGILIDGFDQDPALTFTHTAPWYPRLLEAAGLHPTFPHATYRVEDLAGDLDPGPPQGVAVRPADLDRWDEEVATLADLLNDAFAGNPHAVPVSVEELAFQMDPYRRFMDPEIALVAEVGGRAVGFIVCAPDYAPLLRSMRGSLGPVNALRFMAGRGSVRDAVLIVMGVRRAHHGQGIMRRLQAELRSALRRNRYRQLSITWVSDANARSRAVMESIGARRVHELALFEARLPLDGAS